VRLKLPWVLSGFAAEVDGVPIRDVQADVEHNYYRALSPEFSLVLTADNIFGAPAGTYSPGAVTESISCWRPFRQDSIRYISMQT
jgi:hypothetical protein